MEFLEELLLAALISVLLALLLGMIAADKSEAEAVPAVGDLGFQPRTGLDPIKEEKASDIALGESDCTETKVVEGSSSDERLGRRFGHEEENIMVDEPEIVRINDDADDDQGEKVDKADGEEVERVAELGDEISVEKMDKDEVGGVNEGSGGPLLHWEDEWEGIEKSYVEKQFGAAAKFVSSKKGGEGVAKLSNEVQMRLYGLHKVATEGPCHEPQPMALKVSARAKWHCWQSLGNLNPEDAMEKYISFLTESIPEWLEEESLVEVQQPGENEPLVVDVCKTGQLCSTFSNKKSETELSVEDSSSIQSVTDNVDTGPNLFKQGTMHDRTIGTCPSCFDQYIIPHIHLLRMFITRDNVISLEPSANLPPSEKGPDCVKGLCMGAANCFLASCVGRFLFHEECRVCMMQERSSMAMDMRWTLGWLTIIVNGQAIKVST